MSQWFPFLSSRSPHVPRHFLSFLSDPSRLTGTEKLPLEENSFYCFNSSVNICPGVFQIHPTRSMCPSPRHFVLPPLFSPLFPFLFPYLLNTSLPSFLAAVLLHPLYSLCRSGIFKLGFVKSLKFWVLGSPKTIWGREGSCPRSSATTFLCFLNLYV